MKLSGKMFVSFFLLVTLAVIAIWAANAEVVISADNSAVVVTYDSNGKNISVPSTQVKVPGEPIYIDSISFDVFPYTCLGWSTDPNATEAEYRRGDVYEKEESVILYAVWHDAFDMGVVTGSETWEIVHPYDYCWMWLKFTVSESGWYYFITESEFNHFSWNGGEGIYTDAYRSVGSSVSKGNEVAITGQLEAGTQYYMRLYSNRNDLVMKTQRVYNFLSYDNNGKAISVPSTQAKIPGEPIYIDSISFDVFPYTCMGWSTDPNATEAEYKRGDTYEKEESAVLYAVWHDAFNMGEVTESAVWELTHPYDYCWMWLQFTVSEDGWYYFITESEFNHFSWNGGEGIYTDAYRSVGSSVSKGNEVAITGQLEAGTQYYMRLYSNRNDLVMRTQRVYNFLSYDNNGKAISVPSTQAKIPGEPIYIDSISFDVFPYTCMGWSTDPNATEAEYVRGDTYEREESATLYAVWRDAFDMGEVTGPDVWNLRHPYDYCWMWLKFTVTESGWYYFVTDSEFNHFSWNGGEGIYSDTRQIIGNSVSKGNEVSISGQLEAGTQYYMRLYSNRNDLVMNVDPQYESNPYLAKLSIPNSVLIVEDEAFSGTTFESVSIPESMELIGKRAFAECTNLKKIIFYSTDVLIDPDSFGESKDILIIAPLNSTAYDFAKQHGFEFRRLGD